MQVAVRAVAWCVPREHRWQSDALHAVVWPPAIARTAALAPWWVSAAIGAFGIAAFPSILLSGLSAGIAEPYATLSEYFLGTLPLSGILMVIAFPVSVSVGLLMAGRASMRALEHHRDPVYAARLRAWMLTPILAVLPMVVWCAAAMVVDIRHPNFDLASGKPAWIHSIVFTVTGSMVWPVFIVLALFGIANRCAAAAARLVPDGLQCTACGYDLRGLIAPRCPECGKGRGNESATKMSENGTQQSAAITN